MQANHSQLDENYKKEDLQRENHSHNSDSTEGVKATVPVQVNYSQLGESHRKEDFQRENHSHNSDSTEDVTSPVPDKNDKKL